LEILSVTKRPRRLSLPAQLAIAI